MNFNRHSNLEGQHAFLGASKYHWINYDESKVAESYSKFLATQKGTVLHEFAAQCIRLGQKLPKSQKTLNMYVNDAISFRMVPEQILFYSDKKRGRLGPQFLFFNNYSDLILSRSLSMLSFGVAQLVQKRTKNSSCPTSPSHSNA